MTHQPNCDKNTKACAVYHAQGTPCLEIPCTCKPADLPSLIESGIAEFDNKFNNKIRPFDAVSSMQAHNIKIFLASLATNVHNAAILSMTHELLASIDMEMRKNDDVRKMVDRIEEARAKLSALKEKEV